MPGVAEGATSLNLVGEGPGVTTSAATVGTGRVAVGTATGLVWPFAIGGSGVMGVAWQAVMSKTKEMTQNGKRCSDVKRRKPYSNPDVGARLPRPYIGLNG